MDAAIGEMNDAVGHVGHDGIVGDDDCERSQITIDALKGLEHDYAGADIERAGGFIAEKDFRAFRDGPGDGDTLLLAAGKLRGKMIKARAEIDEIQGVLGLHGVGGNFGDQTNILAGREAGDEIVELKNETDAFPSKAGELIFIGGS